MSFILLFYFLTRPIIPYYNPSMISKNHIVCDSKFIQERNMIQSQNPSLRDLKFINLPIDNILDNMNQQIIEDDSPSFYHHLRYNNMVDKDILSYKDFCNLEKEIADIIDKYTGDKKNHWCIFLNQNFLYSDSMKRFLSKSKYDNIIWITDNIEIGFPDMIMWNDESSSNI